MSGISDGINNLWEGIKALPGLIADAILNGLKEIFIPDAEEIKDSFNRMIEHVSRSLNLPFDSLDFLKDGLTEEAVDNIEGDYNFYGLGNLHLTFFDVKYLIDGVDFFRPLIRGFTVLMLLFFNYKQLLTFIGQDPSIMANAAKDIGGDKK